MALALSTEKGWVRLASPVAALAEAGRTKVWLMASRVPVENSDRSWRARPLAAAECGLPLVPVFQ